MLKNLYKNLTLFLVFIFCFNSVAFAINEGDLDNIKSSVEKYQKQQVEQWGSKVGLMEDKMLKIKNILLKSYAVFDEAEKQVSKYEKELEPIKQSIDTLKGQINSVDYQLDHTYTKITNIASLIDKKNIDIEALMNDIEKSSIEMLEQKNVIKQYIKLIYWEEQQYKTNDTDKNLVNLLVADTSFSQTMQKEIYLNAIENTRQQIFYRLNQSKLDFEKNQEKLNRVRKNLVSLKALLEKEKHNLKIQQIAKEDLLTETEGKEAEYQKLLEESKQQQEESVFEIENLQNNFSLIQEKLKLLQLKKTESNHKLLEIQKESNSSSKYSSEFIDYSDTESFFIWPVSPSQGITAYYHDDSYYNHFKVVHEAIDVRQRQGSPIFAPANGYVYKTKDNGKGYSYIILAHRDGFMTVYGHIFEFLIEEGDLVHTGDLIGLTGGMPGTKGAGWMTTGPHLHFEIYKDGKHVDPLNYLPLEELPIEYIPAEYLKKVRLK